MSVDVYLIAIKTNLPIYYAFLGERSMLQDIEQVLPKAFADRQKNVAGDFISITYEQICTFTADPTHGFQDQQTLLEDLDGYKNDHNIQWYFWAQW